MGLQLSVSEECIGHGSCYLTAPDLLSDDDEGFVSIRGGSIPVPAGMETDAQDAVAVCPSHAISVRATDND
jgi:ferredoxin